MFRFEIFRRMKLKTHIIFFQFGLAGNSRRYAPVDNLFSAVENICNVLGKYEITPVLKSPVYCLLGNIFLNWSFECSSDVYAL